MSNWYNIPDDFDVKIYLELHPDLKNLSENREELFEDVKELKSFNKNSAEQLLEDSHLIKENLLKINSKLFVGVRADS